MSNDRDSMCIDAGQRAKERKSGASVVQLARLHQLQLQAVLCILSARLHRAVPQVAAVSPLTRGEPRSATERKQKDVPVPGEHGAYRLGEFLHGVENLTGWPDVALAAS